MDFRMLVVGTVVLILILCGVILIPYSLGVCVSSILEHEILYESSLNLPIIIENGLKAIIYWAIGFAIILLSISVTYVVGLIVLAAIMQIYNLIQSIFIK